MWCPGIEKISVTLGIQGLSRACPSLDRAPRRQARLAAREPLAGRAGRQDGGRGGCPRGPASPPADRGGPSVSTTASNSPPSSPRFWRKCTICCCLRSPSVSSQKRCPAKVVGTRLPARASEASRGSRPVASASPATTLTPASILTSCSGSSGNGSGSSGNGMGRCRASGGRRLEQPRPPACGCRSVSAPPVIKPPGEHGTGDPSYEHVGTSAKSPHCCPVSGAGAMRYGDGIRHLPQTAFRGDAGSPPGVGGSRTSAASSGRETLPAQRDPPVEPRLGGDRDRAARCRHGPDGARRARQRAVGGVAGVDGADRARRVAPGRPPLAAAAQLHPAGRQARLRAVGYRNIGRTPLVRTTHQD